MAVIVRARPGPEPVSVECDDKAGTSLNVINGAVRSTFSFEHVLGPASTQFDVYARCAPPLLGALFEGRNACLFAYGQTGSGKTYSMLGGNGGQSRQQDGVIPMAADEIFRRISAEESVCPGTSFRVSAEYIEIYCGRAYDLLSGDGVGRRPSDSLSISQDQEGQPAVLGATRQEVTNTQGLLKLISSASERRATEANVMHEHSSRAHALCTLILERRVPAVKGGHLSRTSKLHLVDLAGSENFAGASIGINEGLLALTKVLTALADHLDFVPFRDSPLTRILQSALGGNSVSAMLACIRMDSTCVSETMNTLRYTKVATRIKHSSVPNVEQLVLPIDPLQGDSLDIDLSLNRRVVDLQVPGFGMVKARCVGREEAPLLLYVHGSGPSNSSRFWNDFVLDVVKRAKESPGCDKVGTTLDLAAETADTEFEEDNRSERTDMARTEMTRVLAKLSDEHRQCVCDLCDGQLLSKRLRLRACRHVFCERCAQDSVKLFQFCEVCERAISKKDAWFEEDASSERSSAPNFSLDNVQELLVEAQQERNQSCRIVLQFGNTAVLGSKTTFTTFLKVQKLLHGPNQTKPVPQGKPVIKRVEFNINPGYPCTKEGKLTQPNHKELGYTLEYSMARPFPCYICIYWSDELGIPPVQIPYETVSSAQFTCHHLTVQISGDRKAKAKSSSPVPIDYLTGGACSWLICDEKSVRAVSGPRFLAASKSIEHTQPASVDSTPGQKIHERHVGLLESLCSQASTGVAFAEALSAVEPTQEALAFAAPGLLRRFVEHDGGLLRAAYDELRHALAADLSECKKRHKLGQQVPRFFFHVAIDCPGYGRSPGDCQTIRSYPGTFLSSVVRSLGKECAYALIGSSQGACAIFNAALELPRIANFLAVVHPVGHDVGRYVSIKQPTLLIFDTDDDGHPVAVGRRMQKMLQRPVYFEHSSIKDPSFTQNTFGPELIKLFSTQNAVRSLCCSSTLPLLAKLTGGIESWSKAHGKEENDWGMFAVNP